MPKTPCLRLLGLRDTWPSALALVAIVALLGFGGPRAAAANQSFVSDELLVGFHAGVSEADAQAIHRANGAIKLEMLRGLNIHRIRVAPSALDAVAHQLLSRPEVKFVERNRRLPLDLAPNDPSYGSQWHLPKISGPQAWDLSTGSPDVIIAILDTGVDGTHPDLAAKMVPGYNFYDNNANASDVHGHGTWVAGTAAAIGNNATGVASVAWQNRIMPIRVTDSTGWAYESAIVNALTWAADHDAKVMSISIGGVASSNSIASAAQYARGQGGVVVASAGNCSCVDPTPENPYLISVSATDQNDNVTSWSSQGTYVDIAAPGDMIYTTARGGGYQYVYGTSFSAPIVAGVIALMMSENPSLTPALLESLLMANADDHGTVGWDPAFGFGRVNAYRAVAAAAASVPAPDTQAPVVSLTSPSDGTTVSGTITVSVAASDDTGVTKVELYIDGALYATDTTSPYSFAWNTSAVANGFHTLTAAAYDAAGNTASGSVTVNVNNVPDAIPPSVTIVSVTSARGKGKLKVTVSALDNLGLAEVDLYADGNLVGTKATGPYTFTLNLNSFSAGTHSLQATGTDAAGNVGVSAPVSFTK